jgi:hypothetical protein
MVVRLLYLADPPISVGGNEEIFAGKYFSTAPATEISEPLTPGMVSIKLAPFLDAKPTSDWVSLDDSKDLPNSESASRDNLPDPAASTAVATSGSAAFAPTNANTPSRTI